MLRLDPASDPATPFAVVREEKSALRLYSLNEAGAAAGLALGMALADARAVLPTLKTRVAEPERDSAFLQALHRWAGRFSPFVAIDGEDGLCLDITGCAHLFGGEEAMLKEMVGELARLSLRAQGAVADAKGAAFALARQDRAVVIAPPGETRRALADLPLAALRLERDVVAGLNRLGLARIGDLYEIPRASLARRFGLGLVERLDQALGFVNEPVAPAAPVRTFAARLTLPEPIGLKDDVMAGLARLLDQLNARLEAAGRGMRAARLTARRTDNSEAMIEVGLAKASRDAAMVLRLFERKLDDLDAGFGIELLRLEARGVEPLSARQLTGEPSQQNEGALDELIARLGNRIGFDRVKRFAPRASHIPERAFACEAAIRIEMNEADWRLAGPPRPLTLFPPERVQAVLPGRPPRAISWRGRKIDIARACGPERIAPEWWRTNPGWAGKPKDYWRIEGAGGERLWLAEDHDAKADGAGWTVCGEFP
ncbi:MAG: DNA polymerase Y family protein [Pseudomonadota bacterium]